MSLPMNTRNVRSDSGNSFPVGPPAIIADQRYAVVIANALRRHFGGTHAAVKSVVALTGDNERSVKNWFNARNGPSGENLIDLIRHSDAVLEAVLVLSGRDELITAKKICDVRRKLAEIQAILGEIETE
jgi:hypothetical protein